MLQTKTCWRIPLWIDVCGSAQVESCRTANPDAVTVHGPLQHPAPWSSSPQCPPEARRSGRRSQVALPPRRAQRFRDRAALPRAGRPRYTLRHGMESKSHPGEGSIPGPGDSQALEGGRPLRGVGTRVLDLSEQVQRWRSGMVRSREDGEALRGSGRTAEQRPDIRPGSDAVRVSHHQEDRGALDSPACSWTFFVLPAPV